MNKLYSVFALALLTVLPARGEDSLSADSLQILMQQGNSLMQQYNTFEALKYYQQAFDLSDSRETRTKLADCYYKRANYRETSELLKLIPEDSLSHEAFRQLALSYKKQGDSTFNTLYSAGMSHSQTGNLERAYECLFPALYLSQMQHAGCAYRLGVVCVDTKRHEEGLGYLNLATELMKPDTTSMRAITLSQGEGYYLTEHYPETIEAWKQHLTYNPGSIAPYYNIANAYAYLLKDKEQAKHYYTQFLDLAPQGGEANGTTRRDDEEGRGSTEILRLPD